MVSGKSVSYSSTLCDQYDPYQRPIVPAGFERCTAVLEDSRAKGGMRVKVRSRLVAAAAYYVWLKGRLKRVEADLAGSTT